LSPPGTTLLPCENEPASFDRRSSFVRIGGVPAQGLNTALRQVDARVEAPAGSDGIRIATMAVMPPPGE